MQEGDLELVWTARRSLVELWLAAIFAAIVMLTMAYAGDALSKMASEAELDEPVETLVVDPDGQEPFVVCTIRPSGRRCQNLDLKAGQ